METVGHWMHVGRQGLVRGHAGTAQVDDAPCRRADRTEVGVAAAAETDHLTADAVLLGSELKGNKGCGE